VNRYIFFLITTLIVITGCSVKTEQAIIYKDTPIKVEQQQVTEQKVPSTTVIESSVYKAPQKEIIDRTKPVPQISKDNYIAIVYPSAQINRYALEATNTINGYLLQVHKDMLFHLETFDILRQSSRSINKAINSIVNEGISKVILMITKEYLPVLKNINGVENLKIVLPLINKYEVSFDQKLSKLDILFAGISYQDQFKKLSSYANGIPMVEFYDNSSIGTSLHTFASKQALRYSKRIDDNNGRYKRVVSSIRSKLNRTALILNTPIVKSSMLLSALTAESVNPKMVLSTQLNFTPLVFSLTQSADRKSLVIANSIGELPDMLEGYSELLGNNILYNWVNYSSMIAAEYLQMGDISLFKDISIANKQVIYPVKLYKVRKNSFLLLPY
jgi:hypothetical protein